MMASNPAALADRDLRAIIALVYEQSGISLHDGKRELVAARLHKRLRHLGLPGYGEYVRWLENDRSGEELTQLLDAIATNHTSFFREAQHFDFLARTVLPGLTAGRRGRVHGWCAASSTGEEPVTIAMTMLEAGITDFSLLASDLSTKALTVARRGVYKLNQVGSVPPALLRKYFERGLGEQDGLARVAPVVRQSITYQRLNLVAMARLEQPFDFIFCRNVMIYFDKQVQQRVVSMLERHLAPGGFLFISHSESLNGIQHRLQWVGPAVYRREAA